MMADLADPAHPPMLTADQIRKLIHTGTAYADPCPGLDLPSDLLTAEGDLNPMGKALKAVRLADWYFRYSDDRRAFEAGKASTVRAARACAAAEITVSEALLAVGLR